jgi:hypothetical protein
MAVGLPADAKLEASIFWTVLKVRMMCDLQRKLLMRAIEYLDQGLLCWESSRFDRGNRNRCLWKGEGEVCIERPHRPPAVSVAVVPALLTSDDDLRVYNDLEEGKVAGRVVLDASK